ncbi:rab3 GTPase-activating protein catalytic subunit [Caerostris extrusa]|uniref:Rab3 GTPase-activating protein catalytic subunit n=1 Tax=Caerostris extrusa TaxID=172846 RepID=A0AAV4P3I3_CAEEX|nr:rab3 GTPase-activating protein catalytic subunit [Caerostris extrusa]
MRGRSRGTRSGPVAPLLSRGCQQIATCPTVSVTEGNSKKGFCTGNENGKMFEDEGAMSASTTLNQNLSFALVLDPGSPNMTHCLLHQKLQMLNCCIQRKKSREWQQREEAEVEESEEEEEEEFFECAETSSWEGGRRRGPEGRLMQLGEMRLLRHESEPLYIPVTQDPAPLTEDLLEAQAEVLVRLGAHAEGAALRARMQSASLTSDMEAFKAANPKSCLEDFVRWYSPRDFVEEHKVDEETGSTVTTHGLSARMLLPGNMWLESWESARPVPARRQKRLFDDTREAEKVLHFLASAKISDVVTYLMPMLLHCALLQLAEEEECPQSLPLKLEEASLKAAKVMRNPQPKYEAVLRCLHQAEVLVAQMHSVHSKFVREGEEEEEEVRRFALDLLDCYEVEVPGAGKGTVGARIRHLFSEAHKANQMVPDDNQGSGVTEEFPPPSGKEFIFRASCSRPPVAHPTPQRMYCVVTGDEFRVAGAFTEDTTFL